MLCCLCGQKVEVEPLPNVPRSPTSKPYDAKPKQVAHVRFQSTEVIDIKEALKDKKPIIFQQTSRLKKHDSIVPQSK